MHTTKINVQWSDFVKVLTLIVGILIIGVEALLISVFWESLEWASIFLSIFVLLIMGYFTLQSPMYLEFTDSELILKKLVGKTEIKYNDIENVVAYDKNILNIRIAGSGGFCGFIGLFYDSKLGRYKSYVGNYRQAFIIKAKDNKTYMLSCQDRDAALSILESNIKS